MHDEQCLDSWRENPFLSQHHEHWHLVYPYSGKTAFGALTKSEKLNAANGDRTRDSLVIKGHWNTRHGELFAYMHQQMLARYDAERHSHGLPKVLPLDLGKAFVEEGYDPRGLSVFATETADHFKVAARIPNAQLKDIGINRWQDRPGAGLQNQIKLIDALKAAAQSVQSTDFISLYSEFAERVEPTDRMKDRQDPFLGQVHNDGHLLLSYIGEKGAGCMFWESIAVRDPIFYRWHRLIDDIFELLRQRFPYRDVVNGLPDVKVTDFFVESANSQRDELHTWIVKRPVVSRNPVTTSKVNEVFQESLERSIRHLVHEDYDYHIKVSNPSNDIKRVVLRTFLAPEAHANDHGSWIEMDKFWRDLDPGENLIVRSSRESSVVKKPLIDAKNVENIAVDPFYTTESVGCNCGWPYTLLLPCGSSEGVTYLLAVFVTPGVDFNQESIATMDGYGFSYCGMQGKEYPDTRSMGYPLDRPWSTVNSIADMLLGADCPQQFLVRRITIRHDGSANVVAH